MAMSGGEIVRLLQAACGDAGLDEDATRRVLLAFTIRWGEAIGVELDLAMYEDEMTGDRSSEASRWSSGWDAARKGRAAQ